MLYKELVEVYEELDNTSKRLEKTHIISKFLKKVPSDILPIIILLVQGKIYPDWSEKKIGIASKLVVKSISKTTGISSNEIEKEWKKQGDLGNVAELLIQKKKQISLFPKKLTVDSVFKSLRNLSGQEGLGSVDNKLTIISEMLINAQPKEVKFIVRTVVDNLRLGVGSGSLRDAIVWAYFPELKISYDAEKNDIELSEEQRQEYNKIIEKVQHAYDLVNDFGKVALLLKDKGIKELEKLSLEIGKPINLMLFQKAKDIEDAFSIVGKPAAFEYKYDGFRMQIHVGEKIQIFTRRLEEVTEQFPEVVKYIKSSIKFKSCILDAEAVGFDPKTKKYIAFQNISQRIRRKYDIKEIAEKFPVEVNVFDIIYFNGKNLLKEPFKKRRQILEENISEKPYEVVLAKQIITSSLSEAQKFYEKSLSAGEEGMMAKNLKGIYKPGSRVGYGVKIKSIMEPLDLVIVGAEYGEGKRSGWLSSFYLACLDNGEFKEIGKVSTGLKELEEEGTTFKELTKILKPLITKTEGKSVKILPKIVIEVGYEEIQKSVNYSSGFALRFPRFKRLRIDEKKSSDINTIKDVEKLYNQQRGRNT